jgi:hypothetical protein
MIKKILCGLLFFMFLITNTFAQKKNVIEKGEETGKMIIAEQKFFALDYKGALNTYTDLLSASPNDANLLFHIAECHFEMNELPKALENAEKARSIDPKANIYNSLLLGKMYHLTGKLDEALTEFTTFKTAIGEGKKATESDVNTYIEQVTTAKKLMAKPVDVTITNMSDVINSAFDDKAPMISADGKTLIFTSRRPGRSTAINPDDNKYYEDIYMSYWDTIKKGWSPAALIPGGINTEKHDACTSISADGKQIFLFKNDIEGESRGGDIYVSRLSSSGKWGAPSSIGKPINTSYAELGACISPDGKTLFFVSERPGGFGNADIYIVKRKSRTEWDVPVNIGNVVNTPEDEGGLFLAADGKTLFFTSKGHNSMGGYDIFKTTEENGVWTTPVNLGYPINTINNDYCFSIPVDAQTGYFTSDRKGGLGERDIYSVDLSNYPVLEKGMKHKILSNEPVMAILKGDVFNAATGGGMEAEISFYDESEKKVASTNSSEGSGEYFVTLPAGKTYQIKIELENYKAINEKVEIKAAKEGATIVIKHYLLYKN